MNAAVPSVLVTRPTSAGDDLARLIMAAGVRVHAVPTLATEPVGAESPLAEALRRPDAYDWIVVTSPTGAAVAASLVDRTRLGVSRPRWAAVGPATGQVVEKAGLAVSAMPAIARGVAVAGAIADVEPLAGRRVLLARADAAGSDLPAALRAAGAIVEDLVAYMTIEAPAESLPALAAALDDPGLAVVALASGSAVRGLLRLADSIGPDATARVAGLPFVSIGPSTTEAVRACGRTVAAEAARPSTEELAAAVLGTLGIPSGVRP